MNQKVTARIFKALQNIDVEELSKCSQREIRPILPCLVRMSLISPQDSTRQCSNERKEILTLLSGIELVNSIVALLSIDFHMLEIDVRKEQQLRQKLGSTQKDSILIENLSTGLALEFERSDSPRRLRLVLSELLFIQSQIHENVQNRNSEFLIKHSDLFDNTVYLGEISDVICIALAELPSILHIQDIVETLLHVKNGPTVISWVVANFPYCFREVCTSLIQKSDNDEMCGKMRMQALLALCQMNPGYALAVRQKCAELSRLPALAVTLSLHEDLDSESDVVAFISGLLLSNDQVVRNWFTLFVRTGQKRKGECHVALQQLRDELLKRLQNIINMSNGVHLPESHVVQASALLRLYCALRGIAGIKFQEDEVNYIIQLLTSRPPATPAGVRFVSIGLCMLLACPALASQPEHERKGIEWVQWLVKEEAYFECASGVTASFGEMLLLMAIHFHSNQLSAICDLVCSTLGMKVPIRPNNMTRMKQIFTQEIFTEQVVASHAVKVPVSPNLNANLPGFLPVHCIYQLLKSRAFSKHKVPIKNWIYRQICESTCPLHPVLPLLIEVYVNSILIPNAKGAAEHTNEPMSESEIRHVFQNSRIYSITEMDADLRNIEDMSSLKPSLTAQLLLLYYLLLYEDVRLTNAHNLSHERKVKIYSTEFLSELPIKYLLQQAQKDQGSYAGIFSPLLRLLATHFPHLSLVDDWINVDENYSDDRNKIYISKHSLIEAFEQIETCPLKICTILKKMLKKKPIDIWPLAEIFTSFFKHTLGDIPRYVQELYKQVWLRLNTVLPRCLWIMSINALHDNSYLQNLMITQRNIMVDPLQVLRCDIRVFRCAPILTIVLRVLQASLAASRSQLSRHLLDESNSDKSGHPTISESEREELKTALVATQESAAVQILLEACMEIDEDRMKPGQIYALREIRSLICSYLHQVFIADPSLAKLVHFQGYPRDLLYVTVSGIPSMHICLDFIPELLSQPSLEKQIFAVDLISHLAVQYALPKALSVSRLAVNTLSTLLGVLPIDTRTELFLSILQSLVRICEAFPPLIEDVINLLMLLGRVSKSQASLNTHLDVEANQIICYEVKKTFNLIMSKAVLKGNVY
ncbi:integrator complex subunit 2 isoform X2 [Chrysoperla carnea]|uniref:integrator complex subunit 2 isoform X2 n=1 Tax=Chrysoperla carnea TaxID=189513 RepID=UPI001D067EDD|nr:integrator complex subunit 2 isoform X2 [Chrysoperla carnea]